MSIFDLFNLIGGLAIFLFGMVLMGEGLERRAGSGLKVLLGKLTTGKLAGLLTGFGVTAVIQSSSATTVMVVGFVNSGLMTLKQSINVIMGANIGTTVTAWILSLSGISSDNFLISLFKPTSFSPILALIGIAYYMTGKGNGKRNNGLILLGFALLMFGMKEMSSAVSVLKDVPSFRNMFLAFNNPVLGVFAGAVLTAIIQSSSASVGILQALASTGVVSYGVAIPIIMGQNIGTCITAILSSVGANKNAKRAALVHLGFNVIGTVVWLSVFSAVRSMFAPPFLEDAASLLGIAVAHTVFNVLCTMLLLPMSGLLEKLVCLLIPDAKSVEKPVELDERLLHTPALALAQSRSALLRMAQASTSALKDSLDMVRSYDSEVAQRIRDAESETDHLEDILGTYLVRLSAKRLSVDESVQTATYLKLIGDFERIADHAVNILESAEEKVDRSISFSEFAVKEFEIIAEAVTEILDLSYMAFVSGRLEYAWKTEPLEEVIDDLKEALRTRHILRLQTGDCSIEAGFVWSDLLTNLERVSDHCSNISGCVIDAAGNNMNIHGNLRAFRNYDEDFKQAYNDYSMRYRLN